MKSFIKEEGGSVYHELLMTLVVSIHYDFHEKELQIHQEAGCCVDMSGAVKLAQSIDHRVKQIQTFSGNRTDTCYILVNGKWVMQEFNVGNKKD